MKPFQIRNGCGFGLDVLRGQIGDVAEHYHRLAYGLDDRAVATEREVKSIGQEQTFNVDLDAIRFT